MHHQIEGVGAKRGGPDVLRDIPDVFAHDVAHPDTDQRSQGITRTEHDGGLNDSAPRRLRRPQSDGRLEVVQAEHERDRDKGEKRVHAFTPAAVASDRGCCRGSSAPGGRGGSLAAATAAATSPWSGARWQTGSVRAASPVSAKA